MIDPMGEVGFETPLGLEGWEIVVDGDVYLLFAWRAPQGAEMRELTPAERDVGAGILRGESNATIAKRRGSRPRTVANQVASLFRKLGVCSRTELIARMVRFNERA